MKRIFYIIVGLSLLLSVATSFAWRDPTQPAGVNYFADVAGSISDRSSVTLSSILSSLDRNIAVVNGQYLQKGDTLDNVTVMAINPSAVDFKDAQGEFTVYLYSDVKQAVKENSSS